MAKSSDFEEKYPNITDFVYTQGYIEIGYDENIRAFIKAYDPGGTIYEGKSKYKSIDAALEDLEKQIGEHFG